MIKAYSDGACKKSKIGGWGCAFFSKGNDFIYQKYGGKKETTNQEMELTAMLELLKMLYTPSLLNNCITIVVHSDSMYTLNGIVKDPMEGEYYFAETPQSDYYQRTEGGPTGWMRGWMNASHSSGIEWTTASGAPVKYKELWLQIYNLANKITSWRNDGSEINLKFQWVKGHSGDEGNDIVDRLANLGVDEVDV